MSHKVVTQMRRDVGNQNKSQQSTKLLIALEVRFSIG